MTPEDLQRAILAAPAGGEFVIPADFRGRVPMVRGRRDLTLKAEPGAVVGQLYLYQCAGIRLVGLTAQFEPTLTTINSESGVRFNDCDEIEIEGGDYSCGPLPEGGGFLETAEPAAGVAGRIDGWPIGRAITVDNSRKVTMRGAVVHDAFRGVVYNNVVDFLLERCRITHVRGSCITGAKVDGFALLKNILGWQRPWKPGGQYGDHLDLWHLFTLAGQTVPNRRIRVEDNWGDMGDREPAPGFLLEDNAPPVGHEEVSIQRNTLIIGHPNGIVAENVHSGVFADNVLAQAGGARRLADGSVDPRDAPIMKLTASAELNKGSAITAPVPGVEVARNRSVDGYRLFEIYPGNTALKPGVWPEADLDALRAAAMVRISGTSPMPEPVPAPDPRDAEIASLKAELALSATVADDLKGEITTLQNRVAALVAERTTALSLAKQARAARAKNQYLDQLVALLSAPAP